MVFKYAIISASVKSATGLACLVGITYGLYEGFSRSHRHNSFENIKISHGGDSTEVEVIEDHFQSETIHGSSKIYESNAPSNKIDKRYALKTSFSPVSDSSDIGEPIHVLGKTQRYKPAAPRAAHISYDMVAENGNTYAVNNPRGFSGLRTQTVDSASSGTGTYNRLPGDSVSNVGSKNGGETNRQTSFNKEGGESKRFRLNPFDFRIYEFKPGRDGQGNTIEIATSNLNVLTSIISGPPQWKIAEKAEDDLPWREAVKLAPTQLISLGYGGEITLELNGFLVDEPGPEFLVFENRFSPTESGNAEYEETALVLVAEGLPNAGGGYSPGPFYALGKGGLASIDTKSGEYRGDAFDIVVVPPDIRSIRFIKIVSDDDVDPADGKTMVIKSDPKQNSSKSKKSKSNKLAQMEAAYDENQREEVPVRIEKFSGFDLDSVAVLHQYSRP